jgi:hypothetical protein
MRDESNNFADRATGRIDRQVGEAALGKNLSIFSRRFLQLLAPASRG